VGVLSVFMFRVCCGEDEGGLDTKVGLVETGLELRLGHGAMLHPWVCCWFPCLFLNCVPPPHDTEHVDHDVHPEDDGENVGEGDGGQG